MQRLMRKFSRIFNHGKWLTHGMVEGEVGLGFVVASLKP